MTSRETKRKGKRRQIETNTNSFSSSTIITNDNDNDSYGNVEEMTVFVYLLFVWVGNPIASHSFPSNPITIH